MKKLFVLMSWLGLLTFGLADAPLQANFIQCPIGGGGCDGTDNDDVINGTHLDEGPNGMPGNDIIFGNGGDDGPFGADGNDILFGGAGSDQIAGGNDDDILLAGPDRSDTSQEAEGYPGNDTFLVLVSEVTSCLFIYGQEDNDIVHLIGFGPYIATTPFGQPGFDTGRIKVVDPVTGGRIFIQVQENGTMNTEIVQGLLSPNVTILTEDEFLAETGPQGTNPCPPVAFG